MPCPDRVSALPAKLRTYTWLSLTTVVSACGARSGLEISDGETSIRPTPLAVEGPPAAPARNLIPPPPTAAPTETVPPPPPFAGAPESTAPLPPTEECADGASLVHLVTVERELLRYDPGSEQVQRIGTVDCGDVAPEVGAPVDEVSVKVRPFSMAVDRFGRALMLADDENLYRVSTADAACRLVDSYQPRQSDFIFFGMGYALDTDRGVDTLFVADNTGGRLGRIDATTLALTEVGIFSLPEQFLMELTGAPDGNLFGCVVEEGQVSIARIDKTTGAFLGRVELQINVFQATLACAHWNDDFYVFTSDGFGESRVDRFRPSDGTVVTLAPIGGSVVGAGISTCGLTTPSVP